MARYSFLLLLCLLVGCDSSNSPDVFIGHYALGFEVTSFTPCGADEQWWTTGSQISERYRNIVGDNSYQQVYAVLVGYVSEKGQYGHLGSYSREFDVTAVIEMRQKQPLDCR